MDTTVCLTIEGHLECSEFGTLMNKMLRTFTYQFLQECTISFSGPRNEQIVGMQFLGHMAVAESSLLRRLERGRETGL